MAELPRGPVHEPKRKMNRCKTTLLTLLLAGSVAGYGISTDNEQIEGLCIYKPTRSHPDGSAAAFEYRTVVNYKNVSYVFAAGQGRLSVPSSGEILCIPYPGRLNGSRESALLLLASAKKRFPRHAALLRRIEKAWENDSGASSDDGSARHAAALRQLAQESQKPDERSSPPSRLPTSSLSMTTLKSATLDPKVPKPAEPDEGASESIDSLVKNAPKPVPADEPGSLATNMNIIQRLYRAALRLANPNAAFEDTGAPGQAGHEEK